MTETPSTDSGTRCQGTFSFSEEETAGDQEPSGHPRISAHQDEPVPKRESPSRIFSVGWAVTDRSISENDCRYVCAVVAYDQVIQGSGDIDPARKILEKQFV